MNPQQFPQNYNMQPAAAPMNVNNAAPQKEEQKLVGYMWQRIAICAMVIAGAFLIAMVVMIFIANSFNVAAVKTKGEKDLADQQLSELYSVLKVDDQAGALATIGQTDLLSGNDLKQIKELLVQKYGTVTTWDATDDAINLVRVNGVYKVVSLKMVNAAGSMRALLYARLSDNQWKAAAFDSNNTNNPCKDSTDEEKEALGGIVSCPSVVVEEE